MASSHGSRRTVETASPARNFRLTTEELLRAAAGGVPAYIRRRRRIEDARARLVDQARELGAERMREPPESILRMLRELNQLIEAHNRFFPLEANLPCDLLTGQPVELGRPWKPMPLATFEDLLRALESDLDERGYAGG